MLQSVGIPPQNYELFMQNKHNLLNPQTNVTYVTTRDYKENHPAGHRKNKPNSNPIKLFHICVKVCPERSRRISVQINVTSVLTKHYENSCPRYLCSMYQRLRGRGQIKPSILNSFWLCADCILYYLCGLNFMPADKQPAACSFVWGELGT